MKIFSERHDRCCDLHKAIEKRAPVKLNYDEEAFKLSKLKAGERGYDSRKGKLDKLAEKVAAHDKLVEAARAEIAKVDARIDAMRAKYAADPEFQKHEALLDNGIDLARLTYPEVRTLRCQMQYIFQDPYSSLNPRMTVANIIGEGLLAHKYCKKANERMHEEILQTMEDCGLAPYFLHRYPHQFSRRSAPENRHCPQPCRASEVRRLRRSRFGSGRFHPVADHQPAAGPEGAAST